ncbi:PREDICTED: uncharacterized protein LOC104840059 [Haliaeetus leucocephalus]|uniref:uncharacterized protein LOC104840059 n=1 Tax=Haliaeetus leucocephalus TaxID=52644 RepID=UPI00053CBF52|nr:PREDICTED: uncharacterized protein LOC104840059 [Haliaeetus leucocephalus]
MPKKQEANARSQPHEGLPRLHKRRQVRQRQPPPAASWTTVSSLHGDRLPQLPSPASSQSTRSLCTQTDRLEGWQALPCSRVTGRERAPMPDLSSLPRLEATQAAAPWHALAAPTAGSANVTKLPALTGAAPRPSLRSGAHAVGLAAGSHRELVPPAWRIPDEWSMPVRAERWGAAPHSPTAHGVALESSVQASVSGVPSHAIAASWEPGQQLAARGHLADTTGLESAARTTQGQAAWGCKAPAAQPGPDPPAQWGTRAAGEACEPVALQRCAEGLWERSMARQGRLPPLQLPRGKPLRTGPEDALKRCVVMQIKIEDLEEVEEDNDSETYEDLSGELLSYLEEDIFHAICGIPLLPRLSQQSGAGPHQGPSWPGSMAGDATGESDSFLKCVSPGLSEDSDAGPQKVPSLPGSMARDAAGEADGYPEPVSPALSEDSDAEPAACPQAGVARNQEHSEPLPTSASEDTGFSTSPSLGSSCEESQCAILPASAPEDAESLAPPMPVAVPHVADDGAETVGTARGILNDQDFAARAEGQGSASDGPMALYALLEELPRLEDRIQLWGPQYKKDKDLFQPVQRRATKTLRGLELLSYGESLRELRLYSLARARLQGDLTAAF